MAATDVSDQPVMSIQTARLNELPSLHSGASSAHTVAATSLPSPTSPATSPYLKASAFTTEEEHAKESLAGKDAQKGGQHLSVPPAQLASQASPHIPAGSVVTPATTPTNMESLRVAHEKAQEKKTQSEALPKLQTILPRVSPAAQSAPVAAAISAVPSSSVPYSAFPNGQMPYTHYPMPYANGQPQHYYHPQAPHFEAPQGHHQPYSEQLHAAPEQKLEETKPSDERKPSPISTEHLLKDNVEPLSQKSATAEGTASTSRTTPSPGGSPYTCPISLLLAAANSEVPSGATSDATTTANSSRTSTPTQSKRKGAEGMSTEGKKKKKKNKEDEKLSGIPPANAALAESKRAAAAVAARQQQGGSAPMAGLPTLPGYPSGYEAAAAMPDAEDMAEEQSMATDGSAEMPERTGGPHWPPFPGGKEPGEVSVMHNAHPNDSRSFGPNGARVYICKFKSCGKAFERQHNLKSHLTTHTGDRPYVCATCGHAFGRSHDLRRHQKIHTAEKPFVCESCGKSFTRNDALTRHRRTSASTGCRSRQRRFDDDLPILADGALAPTPPSRRSRTGKEGDSEDEAESSGNSSNSSSSEEEAATAPRVRQPRQAAQHSIKKMKKNLHAEGDSTVDEYAREEEDEDTDDVGTKKSAQGKKKKKLPVPQSKDMSEESETDTDIEQMFPGTAASSRPGSAQSHMNRGRPFGETGPKKGGYPSYTDPQVLLSQPHPPPMYPPHMQGYPTMMGNFPPPASAFPPSYGAPYHPYAQAPPQGAYPFPPPDGQAAYYYPQYMYPPQQQLPHPQQGAGAAEGKQVRLQGAVHDQPVARPLPAQDAMAAAYQNTPPLPPTSAPAPARKESLLSGPALEAASAASEKTSLSQASYNPVKMLPK